MNTLLSYKYIPFNAGNDYILFNGEENLELIEALLVVREIDNFKNRLDIILINDPKTFLEKYYQPSEISGDIPEERIIINPPIQDLNSSKIPLEDLYKTYKKIHPFYKNELGYERDIQSRIELLILRNLGYNAEWLLELATRSEDKGVLFYKNNIVNALKEFALTF